VLHFDFAHQQVLQFAQEVVGLDRELFFYPIAKVLFWAIGTAKFSNGVSGDAGHQLSAD
jgi:hypothetical protein